MAAMRTLGIEHLSYDGADGARLALHSFPEADIQTDDLLSSPATAPPSLPQESRICAPMHGAFYLAGEPGAQPFVTVGSLVTEGTPLGILEAMKTLTRLEAEYSCRICAILVEDGTIVSPGTPLFTIERLDD
ncbi:acetyl-CoA carboxylase biotin carboxyl carrier protein subunit [Asaia sp. As-1742]|nr:acetyl-CoA carboxylase biotin carboxyl carrier protein subunit [Asaia sp. As-1742]